MAVFIVAKTESQSTKLGVCKALVTRCQPYAHNDTMSNPVSVALDARCPALSVLLPAQVLLRDSAS